jgi:hypothetical protein
LTTLLPAGRVLVVDHQAQQHPQRRGIGGAAQVTLAYVEDGLAEPIADVFEGRVAGVALDGQDGLESRMQTDVVALRLAVGLQEMP